MFRILGKITLNRIVYVAVSGLIILGLGVYLRCFGVHIAVRNSVHSDHLFPENFTAGTEGSLIEQKSLTFSAYLFNVTNPEEILHGAKPVLKEIGPFIFTHDTRKHRVKSLSDDTVSYFIDHNYDHASFYPRSLNPLQKVVLLNPILISIANTLNRRFPDKIEVLNKAVPSLLWKSKDIFIRTTAKEILFGGIKVYCEASTWAEEICKIIDTMDPLTMFNKEGKRFFSLLQYKNDDNDGPYMIRRGAEDYDVMGQVIGLKNKTSLTSWPKNTTCSSINGFDTFYFPPILNKDDIRIYVPDVCMFFSSNYIDEGHEGTLHFYKYKSSKTNFASVDEVPENACRCSESKEFCQKRGAFEALNCQGFPFVFSEPHFYQGDPSYLAYIKGLEPDEKKHSSYYFIEPITGAAVKWHNRLQINMKLTRIEGMKGLTNVSEGLFPIAWFEEIIDLDENGIDELSRLYSLIDYFNNMAWIVIFMGILLLLVSVLLVVNQILMYKKNLVQILKNQNRI